MTRAEHCRALVKVITVILGDITFLSPFAAYIIVDIDDLSTSCAAQMEEIDSSKVAGSSTSAGTRFFNSSTVRFGLEVGAEWTDVDSESGSGDP